MSATVSMHPDDDDAPSEAPETFRCAICRLYTADVAFVMVEGTHIGCRSGFPACAECREANGWSGDPNPIHGYPVRQAMTPAAVS
jgi:hypothetical protein